MKISPMELEKLRYPVGQYTPHETISDQQVMEWIEIINNFPEDISQLTSTLSKEQLNWQYRPDGWAIKQLVHHCADSHINSYMRFKLTLTENTPTIRPYFEDRWAELPDARDDDIEMSLSLLKTLHKRWVVMLNNLSSDDLKKEFLHPESCDKISLKKNIGLYAWHCNHHLAHVKLALENQGKFF